METLTGTMPQWMTSLEEEDWQFIKRFVLASGSLKQMAADYSVSYPTVRARLDRLIAKVRAAEEPDAKDPLEQRLRLLVADGRLSTSVARELISAHRDTLKEGSKKWK